MMGWISRSSSSPAGFIDKKRVAQHGAAFSLLENHYVQAKMVMDDPEAVTASDALTVISHFTQMISFLRLTRNEDPEQNCKKFWVENKCADKVLLWLYLYQSKGILFEYEDEKKLVQTLESLCEVASQDGELLGYNSASASDRWIGESSSGGHDTSIVWDGACCMCSLLLDYFGSSDPFLGPPARKSFVILIQLSEKFPQIEKCFSKESELELTNVVISGLSACFAQLPTFYAGKDDQIEPFRTQLKFVDAVIHAAPSASSKSQFADCFTNSFLNSIILPALTQDDGNRSLHRQDDQFVTTLHEEIAIVTDYLKIVCEHLTHPLLVKSLMTFVLKNLIPVLLKRINHSNASVTVSTLGLITTLLNFYCEDLWYELVLRHLMPLRHLMVSQRKSVLPPIDYQDSSLRFLSLIPSPILEVMGPESISFHYSQYLDNENNYLPLFINQEFSFPGTSTNASTPSTTKASVFPMWKYKYDGTDEIFTPPLKPPTSPNPSIQQDPSNASEEEIVQPLALHDVDNKHAPNNDNDMVCNHPLSMANEEVSDQDGNSSSTNCTWQKTTSFTTISLQPSTDEQLHSLGTVSNANSEDPSNPSEVRVIGSDGYGSLESEVNGSGMVVGAGSSSATDSFGPFLDIVLNHLKNLGKLPPDMILYTTEIISILARSRIPLVTSIFLDTRIILQPSYLSFPLLLNIIRVEFEQSLRLNCTVLAEVWNTFCKESAAAQLQDQSFQNSSISSSTSMNFIHSLSNSLDSSFGDNSFTENIKKKINSSSLLNNVFHRKPSAGPVSTRILSPASAASSPSAAGAGRSLNGSELNESRLNDSSTQSPTTNLQNYRHRTGQSVPPESPSTRTAQQTNQSTESLRITATRAIYFSHWLLELASVAHQYRWKRPRI